MWLVKHWQDERVHLVSLCVCVLVVVIDSCGLAALAMAGQLLTGTALDASHLLCRAIELHFSFHGEMFSGLLSADFFCWLWQHLTALSSEYYWKCSSEAKSTPACLSLTVTQCHIMTSKELIQTLTRR